MTQTASFLEQNLVTLSVTRPNLTQRLSGPMRTDHVRFEHADHALILLNDNWEQLSVSEATCRTALPSARVQRLFICGVGLGELLKTALDDEIASTIIAWERDPYLLQLALGRARLHRSHTDRTSAAGPGRRPS